MSKPYIVGITDYVSAPADIESQAFPAARFEFLSSYSKSDRQKILSEVDALLVWHEQIDQDYLKQASRCRIVVRYGVGFDKIDKAAIQARSIPFCNTPDYGVEEVADTACAMILALQRKIVQYDRKARSLSTTWQENILAPLARSSSLSLGIVGVGRIGAAVMQRMRPFGWRLLGYDPLQPSGHEKALGYQRMQSLDQLLSNSDIVSLHCPENESTRGMVDQEFLAAVKNGAILVNTARGGLFKNLDLLLDALRSGRLSGLGIDVLPQEPPLQSESLLAKWRDDEPDLLGKILINPHTAYYSEAAWYEMRYKAAQTAALFLQQNIIRNQIY